MKLTSVCLPGTKCTRGGIFSSKRVDGNGIAADLLWLLSSYELDFIDDNFKESKIGLCWEGAIDGSRLSAHRRIALMKPGKALLVTAMGIYGGQFCLKKVNVSGILGLPQLTGEPPLA
ncbi:MAG: hypothetical protein J7K94_02870 [Dehalococcoidia bacterium]|nr:hypothetical protein [Dehalococcoidia bacterium]